MVCRSRVIPRHVVSVCLLSAGLVLCLMTLGCSDDDNTITSVPTVTDKACGECHVTVAATMSGSRHLATLHDVAEELASERTDQTPEEVLHGSDAENCIACHAPTAVVAADGMTEVEAMLYFFSTVDGRFSAETQATNADEWPHVACETCHDAPDDHPGTEPQSAIFDSGTAQYTPLSDSSSICGQCHGSLRFADTDHRTHDAWAAGGHGDDQQDVADELAAERSGQTPHEVVTGDDPENCVACHAPTAVLVNGGMSEERALGYFFTTTGGSFSAATAPVDPDQWPDVACVACHDPHHPDTPAYFNSSTRQYESVVDEDELCGRCHGSLRFASTDHLSFDLRSGTGGVGVADDQMMGSVSCVDCHMYIADVDGSNSSMQHGHSFTVEVQEDGGDVFSCDHCHPSMNVTATIEGFKIDYADLDETAAANVEAATAAMVAVTDPALLAKLDEAQYNLGFAEGDESGGFHNHDYLMALLNDANDRALEILADL